MRVLVTGATGFLGGHLVTEMAKGPHVPVCAYREGSDTGPIDRLGLEKVRFDLTDPASMRGSLDGVDAVVHLAAYYTFTGRKELYEKVNVQGTGMLLRACQEKGVRRFLYCSSTEAMGPIAHPPADEDAPLDPQYEYGRSKVRAEELVRASGLDWTVLRPSGIYGPSNVDDVAYYFITSFNGLASKFIIGTGRNLIQFVHVQDVVRAFLLALDQPVSIGRTYIISQARPYTYEEVYRLLADILGKREPRWRLPKWLAWTLMLPIEGFNALLRRDNFLWRRETVRSVTSDRGFSIERARRELGYEPRYDLPQGMDETVAWYRENGYL
ncbi:MAG: NAD-dependent epimerase/dehydratase family protein [Methanomassiliicoccales archaeon]|nr:NAD-dependent epimerase/dehydratase family protein [Methanomassiliicoccales archaeon]